MIVRAHGDAHTCLHVKPKTSPSVCHGSAAGPLDLCVFGRQLFDLAENEGLLVGAFGRPKRGRFADRPATWYLSVTPGGWPCSASWSITFLYGSCSLSSCGLGDTSGQAIGGLTVASIFRFQNCYFLGVRHRFLADSGSW